jgi:tetratricopeptide (TPR) repeat protein
MKQLPVPDKWHLYAAQGWVGLGDYVQANDELEKIAPELRAHPDVLEVRLHICFNAKKWDTCVDIAGEILKLDPSRPEVWIQNSFALYELNRTQEAFDQLLRVALRFPDESNIAYNLACYCAQLGRRAECEEWFKKAIEIDEDTAKGAAIKDLDLKPLLD